MKAKRIFIMSATIIALYMLTALCTSITVMPANDRYMELDPAKIPSSFQRTLSGLIFLCVLIFICAFAYMKK